MTILYITGTKTLFFKEPIKSFSKIRLVNCRFINKIYNLTENGTISNDSDAVLVSFTKGNYTADDIIKKINEANKGFTIILVGEKYKIFTNIQLKLNDAMAKFFGINKIVKKPGPAVEVFIKPILSEVYLNADIVDSDKVYCHGGKCHIFSSIILSTNERTDYSPNALYVKTKSAGYITSLNLWITDHENKVIDKSLYDICMCIEII